MTVQKKKITTLIIAVALVAVLAVAGTLMLFTATTDPATNVVTVGNAKIALQEKHTSEADDAWKTVGEEYSGEKFTGMSFGTTAGALTQLDKNAQIKNTGSIPVYTFVKYDFSVVDSDGKVINFFDEDNLTKYFGSATAVNSDWYTANNINGTGYAELDKFLKEFEDGMTLGTNWAAWTGGPKLTEVSTADSGTVVSGGYYYVVGPATGTTYNRTLKELEAGVATATPVMSEVIIPDIGKDPKVSDAWAGVTFELKLTGYAVQSDNNEYKTASPQNSAARDAAFADLKDKIGLWV